MKVVGFPSDDCELASYGSKFHSLLGIDLASFLTGRFDCAARWRNALPPKI
jgi:hypothetical protein